MEERVQAHGAAPDHPDLRLPVQPGDPGRLAAQQLRGEVAQRADHPRLDELDLAHQVVLAVVDLCGLRVAVAGRPALQYVADEHVRSREIDLTEELVEQLSGGAHEGDAELVLLGAGGLAHEHEVGVGVAGAEDDLRPGTDELRTAGALACLGEDGLELLTALCARAHAAIVEPRRVGYRS
jgi:hypothetical protein